MNAKQVLVGIVLFAVFWAFQAGYASSLGAGAWVLGVVLFSVLLWGFWAVSGKAKSKTPKEMMALWHFATAFVVISTIFIAYLGSYFGAVAPAGDPSPLILSFWLLVYGGAMWVSGKEAKDVTGSLVGIIWVFSALHFVTAISTGPNSYLHFALVTGLPLILQGLMNKSK
jgi:hypothetical protein